MRPIITLTLATLLFSSAAFAQTSIQKNDDKTVTFRGSGVQNTQVRNGVPVSKSYVKNPDGTVTFQETQVVPADGQKQAIVPTVPTAVPYPMQPYQPAPYTSQKIAPQPNALPSGVVNPNAVIRVENLQNATTNPKPTNSLGTYNQR